MMRLHYLGPEATFSHEAAAKFCSALGLHDVELVANSTIPQVVQSVADEKTGNGDVLGCIPLENTAQGSVVATWDVLGRVGRRSAEPDPVREAALRLQILASLRLRVEQYLITQPGTSLADIEEVFSHPQALGQCEHWLGDHLPKARQTAVSSTAQAAQLVSETVDGRIAAIGTRTAAQKYALSPSAAPIQDASGNETRFALLGEARISHIRPEGARWTLSLLLGDVPNVPGGLLKALQPIFDNGFDMSRIESRPVGHTLGVYLFFVDLIWPHSARHAGEVAAWRRVREALTAQGVEIIQLGLFPELE